MREKESLIDDEEEKETDREREYMRDKTEKWRGGLIENSKKQGSKRKEATSGSKREHMFKK